MNKKSIIAAGLAFCLTFSGAACQKTSRNEEIQKGNSTVQEDGGKIDSISDNAGAKYLFSYERDYIPMDEYKKKIEFKTVTGDMVKSSFENSNNKGFPRLFISKKDFDDIKKRIDEKDKLTLIAFNALKQHADVVLESPIMKYKLDDANLRITSIHEFSRQLPSLLLMYRLTGEEKYAKRVWEQMKEIMTYPDWGADRHFLDTGIACFNAAITYDWLYDYLSDDQKAQMAEALLNLGLLPGKRLIEKGDWWHRSNNNWNGICNSGLIMGALAIYEKDPELMSEIIAAAANGLPYYIREFEPQGQSEEGLMYWNYGLMYTTLGFEAMQRVLGTDYGLSDTPGLKAAGYFPFYASGPVATINIGDDPIRTEVSPSLMWFAKKNNDPALAKLNLDLGIKYNKFTWQDLIFYNPDLLDENNAQKLEVPLDNYLKGLELISFRESWEDDKALYVAIHAGRNDANHGHLDAGSFYIQALGKYFAHGNLGSDNYTYPGYFSKETYPMYEDKPSKQEESGRWHFYRLRAEGKNTVVINPDTRPDQNPTGVAKVKSVVSKPKGGYAIVDLTDCYKRDAVSYNRGVMLGNARSTIIIQDEIVPSKESTIWWSMHTVSKVEVRTGAKVAIMDINGKTMVAAIQSPADARFRLLDATYLPGQEFPLTKNTPNSSFKKLTIDFKTSQPTTIRVDFYPLEPGKPYPKAVEQDEIIPLDKWQIPDGPLVKMIKPELEEIKVNGQPMEGFVPEQLDYNLIIGVNDEMPNIEAASKNDAAVDIETKGNSVILTLTDKENSNNTQIYTINVYKVKLPEDFKEYKIAGVEASSVPEPEHSPKKTIDGNLEDESRWSAEGEGQWIVYDLGVEKEINYISLVTFNGDKRCLYFSVSTSKDGNTWEEVYKGQTTGISRDFETYKLKPTKARYVKITGYGTNSGSMWNSIIETKIF